MAGIERYRSNKLIATTHPPACAVAPMPAAAQDRLVVPRPEARKLLSISQNTIIRLEKLGYLPPIKLGRTRNSKTYYRWSDILALIEKGAVGNDS
jgi:hypothetical protein